MALLRTALLTILAGSGGEEPDYPLGPLRVPPMTDRASPFRLVDLRFGFADDGETLSSFETRLRVGGSAFIGGEVTGDRRGLFLDTQKLELGFTEERGSFELEGSYRARWFVLGARGLREDGDWLAETKGSVRLSDDVELLFSAAEDFDDSRFAPGTVVEFARTGELPEPAPPARELASRSVGFFYQREHYLELLGEARWSKRRTEASIDLDVERYRLEALVHRAPLSLDAEVVSEKTSGRLARTENAASLSADIELGGYFLARAETLHRWEPGVLRFEDRYRAGLTYFGRRHRFSRSGEAAARILALQRRANVLGLNERRIYDVDGLRRFRERLGISAARAELDGELDELYRAQVRDRNVPQLGFTIELAEDALRGIESRWYRVQLGVPFGVSWPFSRSEDRVEFLTVELGRRDDVYRIGVRAVSYELLAAVFLNREMSIRVGWEKPGITPEEIARGASRPQRFTASYEYAFGR